MKRRIDLNKYNGVAPVQIENGIVSNDLVTVVHKREKLQVILNMIQPGHTVHWVSDGAWSMHELLMGVLMLTGAADVYISSYAMGETPARILCRLKSEGAIKQLFCVLDNRVDVRTAGSLQLIKSIADKYALIDTHAKVTLVEGIEKKVVIVGSANYTENERFEAGIITMSKEAFTLHQSWIKDELDRNK